jgi:arylsulfatase A-like enzyme
MIAKLRKKEIDGTMVVLLELPLRLFPTTSIRLLLLVATFACGLNAPSAAETRPNILFILADDMGWQDTSVPFARERTKWNNRYRTPALERLAREGMKFTQAYSCAVCSPTRVSLLTGQNEARHGVTQWTYLSGEKPSSDLTHPSLSFARWNWNGLQPAGTDLDHAVTALALPQLLKQSGYRIMHFGKGHFGAAGTPGADPKAFGFDVRIGGRDAGGCGSYWGTKNFGAKAHPKGPWRAWDLDHYFGQDVHLTEALTREAISKIRAAASAKQPFFCYFAHYAPHTPIEPDERFAPKYRAAGLDDTEAAYASLIEGMDKSVGDLLELLDELEIADETLVVFTSDNGGLSHSRRSMSPPHTHNAPLSSGKGAHHEGGIRVPLLVRWPGITKPKTLSDTSVIIYDWFPTLLGAAETDAPSGIDGLNLRPVLEGKTDAAFDRSLIWHFPNFWGPLNKPLVQGPGMGPCSTIRRGDWKLIYYHENSRFELFHLAEDLGETQNLSAMYPQQLAILANELGEYLRSSGAAMPTSMKTRKPVPWPDRVTK